MEQHRLAEYVDYTLLKPTATREDVLRLCEEAKAYRTCSVCVNSCFVKTVREALRGTGIKTCCVVGFPLGAMSSQAKAEETRIAIEDGAEEIDMVQNIGHVKAGEWSLVEQDIAAVTEAARGRALVKVILETCLLTQEEIVASCQAAARAGADFVKTSTGFSTGGARAEDIALMRKTVGPKMGVKASGGIRTRQAAEEMIQAGASRIGASSAALFAEDCAGA